MSKIDIIIWASDITDTQGEGILARRFINFFLSHNKKKKIKLKTFEQNFIVRNQLKIHKKVNFSKDFFHKYIGPIYGALYLLFNCKKKILYLNYLPLWNFILFIILPSKTILGPITGGIYSGNAYNLNLFIRKYIFPILCKISLFIISIKFKKVIFSTDLLKSYSFKKLKNTYFYNFILLCINKKRNSNHLKKYDIIFYNKKHIRKYSKIFNQLIDYLSKKFRICVIGDYYNNCNLKNYGYVSRGKVSSLLKLGKAILNSEENLLSLFAVDALNNDLLIFYQKNSNKVYHKKSNFFIPCDYNKPTLVEKKIKYFLKKKIIKDNEFEKIIYKKHIEFKKYIANYF